MRLLYCSVQYLLQNLIKKDPDGGFSAAYHWTFITLEAKRPNTTNQSLRLCHGQDMANKIDGHPSVEA